MENEIVASEISKDFDLAMEDGQLVVIAKVSKEAQFGVDLKVSLSLMPILEQLAAKTETQWDDKLLPVVQKILENLTKN